MQNLLSRFKLKDAIVHPLVFAVFPVLSLYVNNVGKGFLGEAMVAAAGFLILAALLWRIVICLVGDKDKSAVFVSVFFLLFFSYGHLVSAVNALLKWMHLLEKARSLVTGDFARLTWFVIWAAPLAVVSYLVIRLISNWQIVTQFLNVVALTLAVMIVANLAIGIMNAYSPLQACADMIRGIIPTAPISNSGVVGAGEFQALLPLVARNHRVDTEEINAEEFISTWRESPSTGNTRKLDSSPDIYYIVLDMYARADVLERVYHYDNSDFLSFLADSGFYVASQSRANYNHTLHSLASSLNLAYLDEVVGAMSKESTNVQPLIAMVRHNKVTQYLRSRGYTIVVLSGHRFSEIEKADVCQKPTGWRPTEFQSELLSVTPLSLILRTKVELYRRRVIHAFDHLSDAAQIDSPTFVLAHILAPHPPYTFGPSGEFVRPKPREKYERDELIGAYTSQLTYVNRRMQAAIEQILSQSSEPPIIIVQADHGAALRDDDILARLPILNAYYFPDRNYGFLYEGITPVNTFRIVFNRYFGTDYTTLEDRSYFGDYEHPYRLTDVTDELLSGD